MTNPAATAMAPIASIGAHIRVAFRWMGRGSGTVALCVATPHAVLTSKMLRRLTRAELRVGDLRPDMVVAADIRASNGAVLLAPGQEVTEATIEGLRTFSSGVGIVEP